MYQANPKNACAGGYGRCLDVKFTNACNGSCEFCIEKDGFCPNETDVSKLASATLNEPAETVLILGGEPMLRLDDLVKYLAAIRPFKKHIYMTTNGSLLDNASALRIGPYLDAVNISVHHYDPAKNNQVYGTCHVDFKKMAQGIAALRVHGCKVRINANLVKGFLDSEPDVMDFVSFAMNELHADEIRFTELQHCDDLWVDAKSVMPMGRKLPDEPFTAGCEHEIKILDGIRTVVKLGCGLVCKARQPADPYEYQKMQSASPRKRTTRVLYPDGIVRDGWVTKPPANTALAPAQAYKSAAGPAVLPVQDCHAHRWEAPAHDCHGSFGCH